MVSLSRIRTPFSRRARLFFYFYSFYCGYVARVLRGHRGAIMGGDDLFVANGPYWRQSIRFRRVGQGSRCYVRVYVP